MDFYMKFKMGDLVRLPVGEYHGCYHNIFTNLDNAVIEENDTNELVTIARKYVDVLDEKTNKSLMHENTVIINGLEAERIAMISGLLSGMKSGSKSFDSEKRIAANALHYWLREDRKALLSKNRKKVMSAVYKLQRKVLQNTKVKDALVLLSLDEQFEEIVSLTDRIRLLTNERTNEINDLKKRYEKARKQSYRSLHTLLTHLAVKANTEGPRQDFYRSLCSKIQDIIMSALAILQSRDTKRENGKNQDSANGEGTEGSENNEPDVDNTTGSASSSEGDGPEDDESNDDNSDIDDNTDV